MARSNPGEGALRKVWFTEVDRYAAHLKRLDPQSRRMRFAGGVGEDYLDGHAARTLAGPAIVYGYLLDGTLRASAELHPAGRGAADWETAEAAFAVEPFCQDRGIGTALMERTLLAARNRGVRRLVVTCLHDNARMQRIARKFSARIDILDGEVAGTIGPGGATAFSLWRETMSDGLSVIERAFDLQRGLLRRAA